MMVAKTLAGDTLRGDSEGLSHKGDAPCTQGDPP